MKDANLFNEDFSLKYNKIANTIKSCKTNEHTEVAYKMIDNFTKMFSHDSYKKLGAVDSIFASFEFDQRVGELRRLLKKQCDEIHKANNNTIGDKFRLHLEPIMTVLTLWKTLNQDENKSNPSIDKKKVKEDFDSAMDKLDAAFDDLVEFGNHLNYIFDPVKHEDIGKY